MRRCCLTLTVLVLFVAAWSGELAAYEAPSTSEAPANPVVQDTVWLILNHVKKDQRANFERFLEEILTPAVEEAAAGDPIFSNVRENARTLYPAGPNSDSTYTYGYLLERFIPGDYAYERVLSEVYPPEEVEQYLEIPREALDRPQEGYLFVEQDLFEEGS